jgi:hypothetical protein
MKGGFIMRAIQTCGFLACLAVLLLLATFAAYAGPYIPQGPFVLGTPGSVIPSPKNVPGKEYSDHRDKDTTPPPLGPIPDPEQNIAWDGAGGVADTFDYTGSRQLPGGTTDIDREVDALANLGDLLFHSVIANTSALLFSTDYDPRIHYESIGGGGGVWAAPPVIDQHGVDDVDGLEVWGPEPDSPIPPGDATKTDDANRYSLEYPIGYDPPLNQLDPLGIAVWDYNSLAHTSIPWWTVAELSAAIAPLFGVPIHDIEENFNLDGMMNFDVSDFDTPQKGDEIMFTIDPIDLDGDGKITPNAIDIDGGEIFTYKRGDPMAAYLNHGGHLWNTAFNVQGTFSTASENVNALEAVSTVPEPTSILLLGFGLAGLAGYVLHRRRNKK